MGGTLQPGASPVDMQRPCFLRRVASEGLTATGSKAHGGGWGGLHSKASAEVLILRLPQGRPQVPTEQQLE